jgi:hypothetical protein
MDQKCTCDVEDIEEHLCPFEQEICEDNETLCTCCDFCRQQCIEDI